MFDGYTSVDHFLFGSVFTGIVTCIPGVTSANDNPVIQSLDGLRDITATFLSTNDQKADMISTTTDLEGMVELLDKVYALCSIEGSGNASVATRNGGVELLTSICSALDVECERPLVAALKTLSTFLHGMKDKYCHVICHLEFHLVHCN